MVIQDGGARERSIIRPGSGDVNVVSGNKVLVVNCWEH